MARNLASPKTGVGRFFRALADSAAEVAPVAETQAQMFVSLDSTFGAFAEVARPYIQESISEAPPTFDTLIRTAPPNQELPRRTAPPCSPSFVPGIKALSDELADGRGGVRDRRRRAARRPGAEPPGRAHGADAG